MKGSAHDIKPAHSLLKHGGGSVMTWGCMDVSGKVTVINNVTLDSEITRSLPNYREMHLIGRNFIMLQDNKPKPSANSIKRVLKWPSHSPELNLIGQHFAC